MSKNIDMGTVQLKTRVDTSGLKDGINNITLQTNQLEGKGVTVKVKLDSNDYKKKIEELKKEKDNAQLSKLEIKADINQTKNKIQDLNKEISAITKEKNVVNLNTNNAQKQAKDLKTLISNSTKQIEKVNIDNTAAQKRINELKTIMNNAFKEKKDLNLDTKEGKQRASELVKIINSALKEDKKLTLDITNGKSKIKELETLKNSAISKKEQVTLDIANGKNKIKELELNINNLTQKKSNLNLTVTDAQTQIKKIQASIDKMAIDKKKLLIDTSGATNSINQVGKQLDTTFGSRLLNISTSSFATQLLSVADSFCTRVSTGVKNAFETLYDESKSNSKNITNIQKLGYTNRGELEKTTSDLSKQYRVDKTSASNAQYETAQANIDINSEHGKDTINTAIALEKDTGVSAADIVQILSRTYNIHKGRYTSKELGEILLSSTDVGNMKFSDITNHGSKFLAADGVANTDFTTAMGIIAAGTNAAPANEVFTANSNILTEIRKPERYDKTTGAPINLSAKVKKATGKNPFEELQKTGDWYKMFDLLEETQNKGEDVNTDVGSLFSNSRSMFGGDIYSTQKQNMLDATKHIRETSPGVIDRQLEINNADPYVQISDALIRIKDVIKDSLEPALAKILPKIADFMESLSPGTITAIVTAFTGLGVIAGIFSTIGIPLIQLTIGFKAFQALKAVGTITSVASAVGGASTKVGLLSKVASAFPSLIKGIGTAVSGAGKIIGGVLGAIPALFKGIGSAATILMANPVLDAILLITAAIVLLILNWEKVTLAARAFYAALTGGEEGYQKFLEDNAKEDGAKLTQEATEKLEQLKQMKNNATQKQSLESSDGSISSTSSNYSTSGGKTGISSSTLKSTTVNIVNHNNIQSNGDLDAFKRGLTADILVG